MHAQVVCPVATSIHEKATTVGVQAAVFGGKKDSSRVGDGFEACCVGLSSASWALCSARLHLVTPAGSSERWRPTSF